MKYLVIFLAFLCSFTSAQHLLLAGGGLSSESDFFWNRLVLLAGGKGRARVGVITAGKEKAEEASAELSKILLSYGAQVSWIPVAEGLADSANDPAAAALVMRQAAIFIDDGHVERLSKVLRNIDGSDTLVLAALREKYKRGLIAASGSGAAVLSGTAVPITGTSYGTLVHGFKVYDEANPRRKAMKSFQGCVYLARGFNFLPSWLIEPRFNDDNLHGRAIRLLLETRGSGPVRGVGIDKEMALAIYRVGREDEFAEVLGNRAGITIINATKASYVKNPVNITDVGVTFLSEDDKLILTTDEVLPATWKADLSGEEWHVLAQSSDDVFSSAQNPDGRSANLNRVALRLFDSILSKTVDATSWEKSPAVAVHMDRRNAYAFHNDSPSTSKHLVSYANLNIDMQVVP